MIRLIPFLPSDAAAAARSSSDSDANSNSPAALAAAAAALCAALSLPAADFWAWASSEGGASELGRCLDSYLQFARRPHDDEGGGGGGGDGGEDENGEEEEGKKNKEGGQLAALHRAVLLVLLRLAGGDFPSSSSPPQAFPLLSSSASHQKTPLETAAELLTLPRLLDACSLYLPSNPHLARRLARRAWRRCHATLPQALDRALPAVAEDLEGVRQALEGKLLAARRRERAKAAARGEDDEDILAGLRLWRDSCFSLAALAASHRGAAGAMLEACGGGLVASLAGAHDELLPAVEAAFFSRGNFSPSEPAAATATEKVRRSKKTCVLLLFLSSLSLFTFFGIASQPPHSIIRATEPSLFLPSKVKKAKTKWPRAVFFDVRKQRLAVRYPSTPTRIFSGF